MRRNIISIISLLLCMIGTQSIQSQTYETPERTTQLSSPADYNTNIRLKPGKLIDYTKVTTSVLNRLIKAGMCYDIIIKDETSSTSDVDLINMTDKQIIAMFEKMKTAIDACPDAELWGIHLPYKTANKTNIDGGSGFSSSQAKTNAEFQCRLIELCIQYLKPKHIVTHPGQTSVYSWQTSHTAAKANVRTSLVAMQQQIEKSNQQYGTNTVLCLENAMRKGGLDALGILDILDYPGLENVKVCLDTGHILQPLNGNYLDKIEAAAGNTKMAIRNGDVISTLRLIGDKLATLHIQQTKGGIGTENIPTGDNSFDTHLEPFHGGLTNWGEFYCILLKEIGYRGCFLYETDYKTKYKDGTDTSTIESCKSNYESIILPAYDEYLQNNPE